MRIYLLPFISLFIFLTACKEKGNKSVTGRKAEIQPAADSTAAPAGNELESIRDHLSSVIPYSEEELKTLLPAQLLGATATGIESSPASGAVEASAEYPVNDSVSIRVTLVDCAGAGGVGYFSLQYMDLPEENSADEEASTTVTRFNDHKAYETCRKNSPADCSFTFLSRNRFLVYLESRTAGIAMLKQAAALIHTGQ